MGEKESQKQAPFNRTYIRSRKETDADDVITIDDESGENRAMRVNLIPFSHNPVRGLTK